MFRCVRRVAGLASITYFAIAISKIALRFHRRWSTTEKERPASSLTSKKDWRDVNVNSLMVLSAISLDDVVPNPVVGGASRRSFSLLPAEQQVLLLDELAQLEWPRAIGVRLLRPV
jgi:hypothetical protein